MNKIERFVFVLFDEIHRKSSSPLEEIVRAQTVRERGEDIKEAEEGRKEREEKKEGKKKDKENKG
jgi:hypothetical protein